MCKSIVVVDETSCVLAKVLVISCTLYLIDDVKLSHRILDALTSRSKPLMHQTLTFKNKEHFFTFDLLCHNFFLVLRMSVTLVQHCTYIPVSLYP